MQPNSQYFDEKQIANGEMQKLLDFLMTEAYGGSKYYNDIHVKPEDCGAFVVEWVQIPWSHQWGGSFQYVDEDEEIMIERGFPDNHYEYFHDEEEYEEALNDWLKENPGWICEGGRWTNEIEEKQFREEMEKQMKETSDSTGHDWVVNFDEDDEPATASHYENGVPQGE